MTARAIQLANTTDATPARSAFKKFIQRPLMRYFTFAEDQPFVLESGGRLSPVTIAYETYGQLNTARDNAILITHALTGDSHCASHGAEDSAEGWWEPLVGPGRVFDTDRYYVICSNVIGGCQGSTGPSTIDPETGKPYGSRFPIVTVGDMVRAQARLIEHLGIDSLLAVAGGSMGGMQALEWGVRFPERVRGLIPIAAPARSYPQAIAYNEVGRQAIMSDPDWHGGDYYEIDGSAGGGVKPGTGGDVEPGTGGGVKPGTGGDVEPGDGDHVGNRIGTGVGSGVVGGISSAVGGGNGGDVVGGRVGSSVDGTNTFGAGPVRGLAIARMLGMITYQSDASMYRKFGRDIVAAQAHHPFTLSTLFQVESYLEYQGKKLVDRFDANTYLYLTRALDLFDISRGYGSLSAALHRIQCPTLVVGVSSDILYPVYQQQEIVSTMRDLGKPVQYAEIDSPHGHDGFLIDFHKMEPHLAAFLASLQ